jgi:hypothetical protein
MANYDSIATFDTLYIDISDITETVKPSTLKTNIGKMFVEKQIPLRNKKDYLLRVTGLITGRSQTVGQTKADAIEIDRAALVALDDGYKHAWNDGKHNADFAIVSGSLVFNDEASHLAGESYKFTMDVISWAGE